MILYIYIYISQYANANGFRELYTRQFQRFRLIWHQDSGAESESESDDDEALPDPVGRSTKILRNITF